MSVAPYEDREPRSLGIAVVGCGHWGVNHVRTWSELGCLRLGCDPDEERRRVAATQCLQPTEFVSSLSEVLRRDDVQAVVVATPAPSHVDVGIKVLQAGKHLLVEKPMATSVSEAERLASCAVEHGRVLMVGHVLEYHPAFLRLRELVDSGTLGRLRYLYSQRLNYGRFRTEENALWSFAPHDVAMLLRLLGSQPVQVSCDGAAFVTDQISDVTLTALTFPNDVRAHVFVSWLHPFKEHRFVAVGSDQMAVFDDTAPWDEKLVLFPHTVDWVGGSLPVARRAAAIPVPFEPDDPLRRECLAFLSCVEKGVHPLTDARSGLDVLRVLEAAQRSLDNAGRPEAP